MKRVIVIALVLAGLTLAQDVVSVEVKGTGPDKTQAIEDAKRNAVEQALGAAVEGITQMKDFQVIKDVVESRASGYITSYEVLSETPFPDRYEVTVRANVSKSPLKADVKSLQGALGGFRIMTFYDFRRVTTPDATANYDYAYERVNEYLARNGLRYVERSVYDRLKEEARKLWPDTTRALTVAQNMAIEANVPVFFELSQVVVTTSEKGVGGIVGAEATVDIKAYDTYTAEGMGTAVEKGKPAVEYSGGDASRSALDDAVHGAVEKLLYQATPIWGGWVVNGKPYLVRVYGAGYKQLRKVKDDLKSDPRFGGQMEVVSAQGYSQLDLTFKGSADELADAVLDLCAKYPELAEVDVIGFFKNQVNFALPGAKVPEADRGLKPGSQQ